MTRKRYLVYIFLLLLYLSALFLFPNLSKNYHKQKTLESLSEIVQKRLLDYHSLFIEVSKEYVNNPKTKILETLQNQHVYLKDNIDFYFGKIELIGDKSLFPKSTSRHLKESPEGFFTSLPYIDTELINEPLLDIGYVFKTIKGEKKILFTTVLVKEFFRSPLPLTLERIEINGKDIKKEDFYFIKELELYVKGEIDYSNFHIYLWLTFLYLFALLIAEVVLVKEDLRRKIFDYYYLLDRSNESVAQENFLKSLPTESIYQVIYKINSPQHFDFGSLLQQSLTYYQKVIYSKNLKVETKAETFIPPINSSKALWQVFIHLLLDTLIKSAPPSSLIGFRLEKVTKGKNLTFLKFEITDDIVFSSNLYQKFLSSSLKLYNLPEIDISNLIDTLNIFIEINTSINTGNKITILIPENFPPSLRKKNENIISFPY